MKKILSLFALLLTIVIGAKAASVNDLVPISSDWTFIADDITSNGTTKTTANTLYCDGKIISTTGNSVATNKGNSTIGGASHLNSLRIKNTQDQLTFKVAGACTVKFYTQSHSSRGIQAGSTAGGTEYGTQDVSTTTWELELDDAATVYLSSFGGDFYIAGFEVTMAEQKEISSQTLAGVKVGETSLTQDATTAGFSVSGTTITLTDDQASAGTPDNVKLVNHITYTDSSTKDEDVDVTFDGTVTDGYFVGTATIATTEYTVKVKKSSAVTVALSSESGSINLTESWKVGSVKFTLTGANLTDGTYNVTADVAGATISPTSFTVANGEVEQEFTVTSTATTAATTVFTVGEAGMGATPPTYTLTYSQTATKRSVTQTTVGATTTWDWANAGSAQIELTANTDPANGAEFIMAELPEVTNDATFNSQALKVACQWPTRGANSYIQGNTVKFTPTVAGTVKVWFSNTSDRTDTPANRRYLYINGNNSGVYTLKQSEFAVTPEIAVNANEEVVINAYTGEEASTMVRINKIVFTEDNGKDDSDLAVDPAETSVNMEETTDVTYTTTSTGAVTVESSDNTIATATVDATNKTITITGVAAGTATITVSQEADDNYNAGSKEIAVTVINPNVKYVYDATGLTDDEFVLTAHNFGGESGMNPDNQFATTSTGDWTGDKEYGDYSGKFYNMSKTERYITFKVKGAENFRLGVQNSSAGRTYTVKVGEAAAQEITHVGGGVKFTDIFETGTTDEVTIVIAGGGSNAGSVYPVAIQFNVQTSENIAFSDVTTYVTKHALDFSEVTAFDAYAVTQIKTTSVATEKVGQVPAGTPLLIKATGAVNVDVPVIESAEAITNLLLASDGTVAGDGSTIFAYSKNSLKFKKVASTVTIPAGKAYLQITTPNAPASLDIDFDGATAINNVNANDNANSAAPVKVVKNGKLYIGNYNVAGQQVK